MAVKDKKVIKEYESDFGSKFNQKLVPFALTAGLDDCIEYEDRVGSCGCPLRFLEMRHLVATFGPDKDKEKNCLQVKFPVPKISDIASYVKKLTDCGAICIDLVGERWQVVPAAYKGETLYTPSYDLIELKKGRFSAKLSGRMKEYDADITGEFIPKVAIEVDPIKLAGILVGTEPQQDEDSGAYEVTGNESGCTGKLVKQDACSPADISPRYITLLGSSTYEGISDEQKKTSRRFNRKVPVKKASEVLTCIKNISNGFKGINCYGYQGESISRIDLLVTN
jgi:hypothetical protein